MLGWGKWIIALILFLKGGMGMGIKECLKGGCWDLRFFARRVRFCMDGLAADPPSLKLRRASGIEHGFCSKGATSATAFCEMAFVLVWGER